MTELVGSVDNSLGWAWNPRSSSIAAEFTLLVNEQRSAEDRGFQASIVELSTDPRIVVGKKKGHPRCPFF